jgi:tripartite-type tricarboxylate transporter receptor subunit TctC
MTRFPITIVAAALVLGAHCVHAQSPRTVRVLIPSPPGGPSDTQMRLIAPKMGEALGQNFVLDNRASNNGVVSSELGARANPDGFTLTVGNSGTHAVNATLYKQLPYDPVRDFAPITLFSTTGLVIAANPRLPGSKLQDLTDYARKEPGKVNVAVAGATGQLAGDSLWSLLKVQMNNVPYKGSAPAEIAVLSGESHLCMLTPLASVKHIEAGKMKAFAITSAQRHPMLPNVQTVAEQGLSSYAFEYWNGLFAPAKTPRHIVQALHKAAVQALHAPDVKERYEALGFVVVANTPDEYAAVVKTDVDKYRRIILQTGIARL